MSTLKKFDVEGVCQRGEAINANTREQAVTAFLSSYPGYSVTRVDGAEMLGFCEVSNRPVFEDDVYTSDEEGAIFLCSELKKIQ